jgi:hypothetical protein
MQAGGGRAEDQVMTVETHRSVKAVALLLPLAIVAAAWGLACSAPSGRSAQDPSDPLTSADFRDPVDDAKNAGVSVYWLGPEFDAGGLHVAVYPEADFTDDADSRHPGLSLDYFARIAGGSLRTGAEMYSKAGNGPQIMLERASAVHGSLVEEVQLGGWHGNLVTLPAPEVPANKLWLFVDLGDTVAIVQANSGSTGSPGTDVNTLIDKDLLIQVVAENHQPIPE